MDLPIYLLFLFFPIAFIYSSVGHGGASGYMAVLAITGYFSPELVPVILCLNILVSSVALTNYSRRDILSGSFFDRLQLLLFRLCSPVGICSLK